jgi:hypothetical protein
MRQPEARSVISKKKTDPNVRDIYTVRAGGYALHSARA